MPDLSKIKLDGTTYNLKDSIARTLVIPITTNENGEMQPVGTTLIEAIEAFNAGRRIVLRNNNYDLYIDHADNTSLEGTSNNPDGNGYFHVTWDSSGLTGSSVGMPPKRTSDLINDSNFTTTSEVNSLITSAVGNINSFEISVVTSLPTFNINTHTIYFISNSSSGDSIYDEYMYINNNWEKIGSTAVDLSNYLQKTDISDWAKQATKPAYTASEVGAIANTEPAASITQTNINDWTKKSNLFTVSSSNSGDDYWWKLKIDRSSLFAFSNAPGGNGYLRSIDLPVNTGNAYATIQFPTTSGKLALVSDISSIVPTWARATNKPTYTASEVGAIADTAPAAGITSADISSWNAKVSDDKTWNEVILNKSNWTGTDLTYVPHIQSMSGSNAYYAKASYTPTSYAIAKYNANAYLISTTPSANDNSTKVATTAYVDSAIPDITGKVSKTGDTMTGSLVLDQSVLTFTTAESTILNIPQRNIEFGPTGIDGSDSTAYTRFAFTNRTNGQQTLIHLKGIHTPSGGSEYNNYAASKEYVDNAVAAVTDTNTTYSLSISGSRITLTPSSGSATYVDLPVYDGGII